MKKLFTIIICLFFSVMLHAHPSWGIAVDKKGNIYFADIMHNGMGSLWKLNTKGELILLFKNFHAHNVVVDKDGNIYSSHGEGDHTMIRIKPSGVRDTLYYTRNEKEFFGGNATYHPQRGIVFGIENHLWQVEKGKRRKKVSTYKFTRNQAVFIDEEGNIYAPDLFKSGGSLVMIDSNGNARIIATNLIFTKSPDPHNDVLLGMTKGPNSKIYIAETSGRRILKIGENQKKETFYTSEKGWFPSGITFFNKDTLILEYSTSGRKGPRITKLSSDGKKELLFDFETYKK